MATVHDAVEARRVLKRFGAFADRFADCFGRRAQRTAASQYIEGLCNDSERKSMQAMHGRLSDPGSYQGLQHFITHSPWDADRVWTCLQTQVPARTGLLAIDDTGLPKQGRHSVGVKRQYCGAKGKIANCQVAVSSLLLSETVAWPLAFDLYLPDEWCADAERRAAVQIPRTVRFREKWRMALAQVRRLLTRGFTFTAVLADADYGSTAAFRAGLERLGLRYAVGVRGDVRVRVTGRAGALRVEAVGRALPEDAWETVTWGTGTKGPLRARFAARRVRPVHSPGERWLLCERSLADDARKYYLLHLDATASLTDVVRLARSRWPIEQQYRELKDDLGFDHFEGRTYPGWMHHAVLSAVAYTFLQLERLRPGPGPRPTLPAVRLWVREIFGLLHVINSTRLMTMLVSFQRSPPLRI
jgi:SRSO17 transposase